MKRLKVSPQRKVIRTIEKNRFKKVRTRKHTTFKKTDPSGNVLTTWVPLHKEVTVLVLRYIIKQTRKPTEEFY